MPTLNQGLSTNRNCASSAGCLREAGQAFVVRYYSRTTSQPEKHLTAGEAAALAAGGLKIVTVYQDRGREAEDFGRERGELDGMSAFQFAGQAGQPTGSAIYFAVDTDFSEAQLRALVIPYFAGIKAAFEKAAPNAPSFRIGVYGSGLACRLLRNELYYVEFTWLAEATGWRESSSYVDWNIKQFVNREVTRCELGVHWEGCLAQASYGQFVPIGHGQHPAELRQMMVMPLGLNLRSAPTTQGNAPLVTLPQGAIVDVLGTSIPGWVHVRSRWNQHELTGYVSRRYLGEPTPEAHALAALEVPLMPPAHLGRSNMAARRDEDGKRAFPLSEARMPVLRADAGAAAKCADLRGIGDWLAVGSSQRYRAAEGKTYCNVYAADYCYLAGIYLPRVWWTPKALAAIANGQVPAVAYGQTVSELRADDLYQWLLDYGAQFGWRQVFDAAALQETANRGGVGVICADREVAGRSGHITVVVPEDAEHRARYDGRGAVAQPLQSQAGTHNYRYGSAGDDWWLSTTFRAHGFFIHD